MSSGEIFSMKNLFYILSTLAVCAAVCSCSNTRVTQVWKDSAYKGGPVSNIMVIGISKDAGIRRSYEDSFTAELEKYGIKAVPSWKIIPDEHLSKDALALKINELDIETVLITHLLGIDKEEVYTPPTTYMVPRYYRGGYYGYYDTVYNYVHQPGYYTTHTTVRLETNLYDSKSADLIWSARSATLNPYSDTDAIRSVIKALAKNMKGNGLLP